ncbi:MAG: bifunctional sulfate adenylyltransferase/adenylylsulfate kinase [Acidobacteriota bacterium]
MSILEASTKTELRSLLVGAEAATALRNEALHLKSWDLDSRQTCDLELLLNGGFTPLGGFLGRQDYESVLQRSRLVDGTLWPIPVTLDVDKEFAAGLALGERIVLRHAEGMALAVLTVSDRWTPDRAAEARAVLGSDDEAHPEAFRLLRVSRAVYLGGRVEGIEASPHHTFRHLRQGPGEVRAEIERRGLERVVAFQTRNPLHRAHVELIRRAAEAVDATVLLHPVVGRTKPGDIDYFTRVRCYQAVLPHLGSGALLSLLPLAMRMAGPREAVWHAILRRNFGATHFVVGRDHAGPGRDSAGRPFYHPDAARQLAEQHAPEVGIEIISSEELVYCGELGDYLPGSQVKPGSEVLSLSGTEFRKRLREGAEIPEWFSYEEVVRVLRRQHPPRSAQGFTVFFTGLSGAGKSTIANILVARLTEEGSRPVTLLDGDLVRKNLSSELGFSRQHRDLNILRIGFVANEITRNGGAAVCAPIAPYAPARRQVRQCIEEHGGFVEVHVATSIEVCESRDRKGLYAKARAGLVKGFTGIDDPYDVPEHAELVIDAGSVPPEEAAEQILRFLVHEGYLPL